MKTEATLLREIAAATTLREQAVLVAELDATRAHSAQRVQNDRDLDFTAAVVEQTLSPVLVHSMHTASTDWLDEVGSPALDTNAVIAEAALWFGRTSAVVKQDHEEFSEQARGQARRVAGAYGEAAPEAERAYLDYVAFLHRREGASGLDQIQQTTAPDGVTNKPTPLPEDVFDNFAEPINEFNQGADEAAASTNAPLLNEILGEGGGMGSPEVPNSHSTGDEKTGPQTNGSGFPVGASLVDAPTVANGYLYNLDEFRAAMAAEASVKEARTTKEMGDRGDDGKCVNCTNGNHSGTNGTPGCRGRGCTCSGTNCGKVRNEKGSGAKAFGQKAEAASMLPQIQQVTDVHDQPAPTPMPMDVMFPIVPYFQGEHAPAEGASSQQTQASLDPRLSSPSAPASRLPFVEADMFGTSAENALVVGGENPEANKTHDGHLPGATDSGSKSPVHGSKDFERAYAFARGWSPEKPIVRQGSVQFEAGLYAGMADNSEQNQQAWIDSHARWAAQGDTYLDTRIAVHAAFSQEMQATAGTTTDLDTMDPGLNNPSPAGDTPLNGPGQKPPLAGGMDAAAPGGASPYNGAEPFSTPVAPDPGWTDPQSAQRQAAFRQRVQQGVQALAEREPKSTPVCRGCGEAFENRSVAEQAHGKLGCGTESGERGYEMRRESEAW